MGGTFDPIHIGHLILAEKAYEELALDEVWFMPSGNPPHKQNREGRASENLSLTIHISVFPQKRCIRTDIRILMRHWNDCIRNIRIKRIILSSVQILCMILTRGADRIGSVRQPVYW